MADRTHYTGCYREHPECAVAAVEQLLSTIAALVDAADRAPSRSEAMRAAQLEKHAAAAAARAATMRGLPNDIAKAEGYADGLADALAIAMSGDLARVLACERGDQSAAPPGWEWDCGEWYRDDDAGDVTVLRFAREWVAEGRRLPCSITAPTALEAMEAADAVLARQEDSGHG